MDEACEPGGEAIVVPYQELSAAALQGVIESFVLREGTEYGETDFSLEQKVAHVMRQLQRKEAHIVFDPDSESVNVVVSESFRGSPIDSFPRSPGEGQDGGI